MKSNKRLYPPTMICPNRECHHKMMMHDKEGCRINNCLCRISNMTFEDILFKIKQECVTI